MMKIRLRVPSKKKIIRGPMHGEVMFPTFSIYFLFIPLMVATSISLFGN